IANRILARENILDGYGHVSVRSPENGERFYMSRSRSPELITRDDLMEFTLDCEPIDQRGRPMYSERPIHGMIYEARPEAMAVVHSHVPSVLPFGVTGAPLRPLCHMAAIIGADIPVWDIADEFGDTNLLVRNRDQGRSLARTLGKRQVTLMRGHGCAIAAGSLPEAVWTAIYLELNARLQMQAQQLGTVKFLSPAEIERCAEMAQDPRTRSRSWEYWRARAGYAGI
ncbi:MAG: class II aldolase/adducin family protein, partial [Chloroflexota bacterium]|nr:class II aldolase/adducin family protein [Chloroflexota bacterium]